jgi:hypothetical protein
VTFDAFVAGQGYLHRKNVMNKHSDLDASDVLVSEVPTFLKPGIFKVTVHRRISCEMSPRFVFIGAADYEAFKAVSSLGKLFTRLLTAVHRKSVQTALMDLTQD